MKKMLKWVLVPIAVIVAVPLVLFMLLLFCFPIRYKVLAKIDENKDINAKVSYLFGLVRLKYSLKNGKDDASIWVLFLRFGNKTTQKINFAQNDKNNDIFPFKQKNVEKEAVDKETDSKKLLTNLKDILTFGEIKTIIKDSFKTIKKLLVAIRPKFIDIEGEFGRLDPAETAIMYGGYEAVSNVLGIRRNVRLLPVFNNDEEVLRLRVDVRGRVNIYMLLIPVVRLLLSKPIRNLILKGDSDE